jgi:hypothetical protein
LVRITLSIVAKACKFLVALICWEFLKYWWAFLVSPFAFLLVHQISYNWANAREVPNGCCQTYWACYTGPHWLSQVHTAFFCIPSILFVLQLLQSMHPKFLQEDVPDEFATLIINFISRNRIGPHGIVVCFNFFHHHII